jgi:hypothetical protein
MSEKQINNERWWDFYLIRYLMGTVLGAIIFYLVLFEYRANELILGNGYEDILNTILSLKSWYSMVFLLVGGMIFSYFSSSPVLILHTLRLVMYKPSFAKRKITLSLWKITFLIIMTSIIVCISKMLFDIHFGLMIVGFILLIPFLSLIYFWASDSTLIDNEEQFKLQNLAFNLSKKRNDKNEYVQTYKHLREHGNAFFIVVLEIILGLSLFQAKQPVDVIVILSVWVVPPVLIWFFANYLESFLLKENEDMEN